MWTQTGTGTIQPVGYARTPAAPAREAGQGARRRCEPFGGGLGQQSRRGGAALTVTTTRWQVVRDLLGGSFLLAVCLALWTLTWAAVAGPLSPVARPAARPEVVETVRAEAAASGPSAAR